jgi:hypothetical protein
MKALKPITSRLRNPRSRSLRLAVLVLAGAAMLSAIAAQTHHRMPPANSTTQDDAPLAPLVGRDYSMRLDVVRGRMQFFDASARIAGMTPIASHGCEADLARLEPGLWLAVPQPRDDGGTDLLLQPMGATAPGRMEGVVLGPCDGKSPSTALSGKVRAHMLERGGGVVFVDAGAAPAASSDRSTALASKVP